MAICSITACPLVHSPICPRHVFPIYFPSRSGLVWFNTVVCMWLSVICVSISPYYVVNATLLWLCVQLVWPALFHKQHTQKCFQHAVMAVRGSGYHFSIFFFFFLTWFRLVTLVYLRRRKGSRSLGTQGPVITPLLCDTVKLEWGKKSSEFSILGHLTYIFHSLKLTPAKPWMCRLSVWEVSLVCLSHHTAG